MAVAAFVEFGIRRADNPASQKSFLCFVASPGQIPNIQTAKMAPNTAKPLTVQPVM